MIRARLMTLVLAVVVPLLTLNLTPPAQAQHHHRDATVRYESRPTRYYSTYTPARSYYYRPSHYYTTRYYSTPVYETYTYPSYTYYDSPSYYDTSTYYEPRSSYTSYAAPAYTY